MSFSKYGPLITRSPWKKGKSMMILRIKQSVRRRGLLAFAGVVLLGLIVACGGDDDPTPTKAAPTATSPAPTATSPVAPGETRVPPTPTPTTPPRPAWEIDWEQTLAAANEEGEIITTGSRAVYRIAQEAFSDFFPDITVEVVIGRGSALGSRLIQEHNAGIDNVDVYASGGSGRQALAGASLLGSTRSLLIRPDVVDDENWIGTLDDHFLDDVTKKFGLAMIADSAPAQTWINTNFADLESFDEYIDVFNPEFVGRWCIFDPRQGGAGVGWITQSWLIYGKETARRMMTDLDPILIADGRRITELMLRGECIVGTGATPDPFHAEGLAAEIRQVHFKPQQIAEENRDLVTITCCGTGKQLTELSGWTSSGVGGPAWVANSPHPNAAKIFMNWMASQEGHIQWQLPRALDDGTFIGCSPRADMVQFGCNRNFVEDGKAYVGLDYDSNSHLERAGNDLAVEIFGR